MRVLQDNPQNKNMKNRHSLDQMIRMLGEIESNGLKVSDTCRPHAIGNQTYFRWKKKVMSPVRKKMVIEAIVGAGGCEVVRHAGCSARPSLRFYRRGEIDSARAAKEGMVMEMFRAFPSIGSVQPCRMLDLSAGRINDVLIFLILPRLSWRGWRCRSFVHIYFDFRASEGDHLEIARLGTARTQKEVIITFKDNHLHLLRRKDCKHVAFLDFPFPFL